tara:strand:- start:4972 stop:7755 length:2784 start_codon:yes stop_codon:yes gene_type:complete
MATNIDKALIPSDLDAAGADLEVELSPEELDLSEEELEELGEEEREDGSVVIDFSPDAPGQGDGGEHEENLAEVLEDAVLTAMSSELTEAYKADRLTRSPWEKAYIKGISLLGLQIEERSQPWSGASGVFHPILTEAVIKFQADAMTETFPAAGPVLTRVAGKSTREKDKQAKRVQYDMNYQCTEVMTEYRGEHEQALFHLAIGGSIFKKVYFDTTLGRQTSKFVMADDFVVAYGTSDLLSCPRMTHVMKMYPNDLLKAQHTGQYRDIDVPEPTTEYSKVDEKEAKVSGEAPSAEKDDRHTLLEMHVEYDIEGFEDSDEDGEPTGIALPYIITIDKSSDIVLSVYRNWDEDDENKTKNEFFIHYPYLPGLGFYGIGLVHLLGGIAKSATSILRQLVDAGTLSNLPAGLKSRGLRIKGDNSPLRPGEFRDVDVPGGAIKDNITFIPYKEPSTVLHALLGQIVEEGRNIASIADLKISDMNNQAPVGTTLAILERGMKVMSGVHARIHAAMRREFKLIAALVRDHAPAEYEYEVEEGATRAQDYDDRVDILPVSNPNASTMAHRVMKHQAVLQLAASAPQIYDMKELHRQMIDVMGLENPDKIIPLDDDMKPMDPVAENMAILTNKPVKAHVHQDHGSHIRVHLAASEDPKILEIISKSPAAKAIGAAGAAHIQEHVAFEYRRQIEKQLGVPLPEYDADLPADAEVQLSKLVADAADKLLKKDIAEAQAAKNAQAQNDPVLQLQKLDAETKAKEVERKGMADKLRGLLGMEQIQSKEKMAGLEAGLREQREKIDTLLEIQKLANEEARQTSQDEQAGVRMGIDVVQGVEDDKIERERIASQEKIAGFRGGTDIARAERQASTSENQAATQAETSGYQADKQAETSRYQADKQAGNTRFQAMTNMAGKFMDTFRTKKEEAQKSSENEENS